LELTGDRFIAAEFGKLPDFGFVECQDNVLFGYAEFDELVGNACFSAIVLYPDFVLFDVEVEDAAEGSFVIAPTDVQELVVIVFAIEEGLDFVFVCGSGLDDALGTFGKELANVLAILFDGLFYSHWIISSCWTL
jgi:hypothetical protein